MADLRTVKNRDGLKPQREPYWQRLAVGQFLGYRPLATGPGGNWIARYYDSETRKQQFHAMGDSGTRPSTNASERRRRKRVNVPTHVRRPPPPRW